MFWSVISRLPQGLGPNPIDDPLVPPFEGDPNTVTPGVAGFFAIFFVAVVSILIIVDMARRIRRVRYRGEVRERLEAEAYAAENGTEADPSADSEEAVVEGDVDADAGRASNESAPVERRVDREE